jgi:hypothetical protein
MRVLNYSGSPYKGWLTTTTGAWPTHETGVLQPENPNAPFDVHDLQPWEQDVLTVEEIPPAEIMYALGKNIGTGRSLDLYVNLQPGEGVEGKISLGIAKDPPPAEPYDPDVWGVPYANGFPMEVKIVPDGAGLIVKGWQRLSPFLLGEIRLKVFPGQPWATGELLVTASNASVDQLVEEIPPITLELRKTDGEPIESTYVFAYRDRATPASFTGQAIADGQILAFPFLLMYPSLFGEHDWQYAAAAFDSLALGVVAEGDDSKSMFPLGFAESPTQFDPIAWVRRHLGAELNRLGQWTGGPLGVAPTSGTTGAQEDQGFVKCSENDAPRGFGAYRVRYLTALHQGLRPCNHLEADGSLVMPENHPRLVFWNGRAHWHSGVSPDQLGKTAQLTTSQSRGWYGPDRQHWLVNTLASAYLLTGSSALQTLLAHQARNFLLSETLDPRLSTSGAGAARGIGWTALVALWLDRTLEDEDLRQRVRERFKARVQQVIVRDCARPGWEVKHWMSLNDPRVLAPLDPSYSLAWMPYQQAVGAFGLYVAGRELNIPEAEALGTEGALTVFRHGYTEDHHGHPVEWDFVGIDVPGQPIPAEEYVEGRGAHRTGWFRGAWSPWALWVVGQGGSFPTHETDRARRWYNEIRNGALSGVKPVDWLPELDA